MDSLESKLLVIVGLNIDDCLKIFKDNIFAVNKKSSEFLTHCFLIPSFILKLIFDSLTIFTSLSDNINCPLFFEWIRPRQ